MSSSIKLSLLALVSGAAAIPHSGHSRFHRPSYGAGYGTGLPAYPSGGWNVNSTAIATQPTGPTGTGVYGEEPTTTLDSTLTSTTTLVSTLYVTPVPVSSGSPVVGDKDVPSSGAGNGQCGPKTITVTASDKVTVTVTPGAPSSSAASSSAVAEEPEATPEPAPTPEPTPEPEQPSQGYPANPPAAPAPSSVVEEETEKPEVTISLPNKPVATPAPTTEEAEVPAEPTATPSAVPSTPASPPSYSGGKRGLAYNDASLCKNFEGSVSFTWNWASAPHGETPAGAQFIPMPWANRDESAETFQKNANAQIAAGSKIIMGFNEPDHPDQSNMDAVTACTKWKEYLSPVVDANPDLLVLGPSVTNGGDKNWGLDWLQQFQDKCDVRWDAANIHFYDIYQEGEGESDTLFRFQRQIKNAAEQTGKKVWVTEFGLNPGSASPAQAKKFLEGAIKFCEESDLVSGYSYFMVGTGENQLNAGTGLSELGKIYATS